MGFKTEFNWALKISLNEDELEKGAIYEFTKNEHRVYPVELPIDLINSKWEAVAKVVVIEFSNHENKTSGKYRVLKIYNGKEKEILTEYWRETVRYIKGEDISDFSDVKVS